MTLLIMIGIAGCATSHIDYKSEEAHIGELPKNFEWEATNFMLTRLKFPLTAEFDFFEEPYKGYLKRHNPLRSDVEWSGWIVPIRVKAENDLAQRTSKIYAVMLNDNGTVYGYVEGENGDGTLFRYDRGE